MIAASEVLGFRQREDARDMSGRPVSSFAVSLTSEFFAIRHDASNLWLSNEDELRSYEYDIDVRVSNYARESHTEPGEL